MPNLSSFIKSIRDIMREDRGLSGDGQRIEQPAWLLFFKIMYAKAPGTGTPERRLRLAHPGEVSRHECREARVWFKKTRHRKPIFQLSLSKIIIMHTAIKVPLRSLNPVLVRDLQEKYPNAEVSVVLHKDPNLGPLSENRFWEMIALLDWSKEGDNDAVIEPAVEVLAKSPVRHIYEFEDILSEKLYLLDGIEYARNTGESAWKPGKYMSVDGFLYDRCCVVANGRAFYEQVLKDPAQMPKDLSFGALLRVAHEAYKRKTGKNLDYVPAFNYETYSNEEGWKDVN